MNGKSVDSVKLVPGWMSTKKSTSAAHRYSKAALLDAYDPGADVEGLPQGMIDHAGLTSVAALVPVNIAPSPPVSPPKNFSRSGVEAIISSRSSLQPGLGPVSRQAGGPPEFNRLNKSSVPAFHTPSSSPLNSRDFWSGSAHLAPAERPSLNSSAHNGSSQSTSSSQSERRPLILKPRTVQNTDGSSTAQPHHPYWSRSGIRSAADANSNWRGSAATLTHNDKQGVTGAASTSGLSSSASSSTTSARETLRRTNNRDLSALTKGSARESSGSIATTAHPSLYHNSASGGSSVSALENSTASTIVQPASSAASKSQNSVSASASATGDKIGEDSSATSSHGEGKKPRDRFKALWYYRDPQGSVQGPFSEDQIMQWHKAGYYDEDLPVSHSRDSEFVALAVAFGLRPAASAPPGFVGPTGSESLARSDKTNTALKTVESEKPSRTVEDMAQEVERMRIEARNRREESVRKSNSEAGSSILSVPIATSSIFDETPTSMPEIDSIGAVRTKPDACNVEASKLKKPSRHDSNAVECDTVVAKQELRNGTTEKQTTQTPELSKSRPVDGHGKVNSPVQQSRFASFMSTSSQDVKQVAGSISHQTKEKSHSLLASTSVAPTELSSHLLTEAVREPKSSVTSDSDLPAWNVVMQSLQKGDSRSFASALPPMPTGSTADHDIAALDPAIAHASFGRRGTSGDSRQQLPQTLNPTVDGLQQVTPQLSISTKSSQLLTQTSPIDDGDAINSSRRLQSLQMPALQAFPADAESHPTSLASRGDSLTNSQPGSSASIAYHSPWVQGQSHSHILTPSQTQAIAHARAQAQAHAQAQAAQHAVQAVPTHVSQNNQAAQAVQAAQVAQARAHAQAQVNAQVAQAHARVHMVPAHQDPLWPYRQQIAQLQARWEIARRGHAEMSQTVQATHNAVNAAPAGSIEQQRALSMTAQAEAALKEHTMNLDRIQHALQTAHAQQMRHQQMLAQQQHQQQHHIHSVQLPQQDYGQSQLPHQHHALLVPQQQHRDVNSDYGRLVDSVSDAHESRQAALVHSSTSIDLEPSLNVVSGHEKKDGFQEPGKFDTNAELDKEVQRNDVTKLSHTGSRKKKQEHPSQSKPEELNIGFSSIPEDSVVRGTHGLISNPSDNSQSHRGDLGEWETVERKLKILNNDSNEKDSRNNSGSSVGEEFRSKSASVTCVDSQSNKQSYAEDTHLIVISSDDDPRLKSKSSPEAIANEVEVAPRRNYVTPAPWSKAGPTMSTSGLSLLEIQRQEELRSRAAVSTEKEEAAQTTISHKQAPAVAQPWGGASASFPVPKMDLREQMRIEEERKQRAALATNAVPSGRVVVPPAATHTKSDWASLVASSKPVAPRAAGVVVSKPADEDSSFWDSVTPLTPAARQAPLNSRAPVCSGSPQRISSGATTQGRRSKAGRSVESSVDSISSKPNESDSTLSGFRISSEFMNWCTENIQAFTGGPCQDVSFVEYLCSIKSSEEIRETLMQNLGSNEKASAFADEFIRRVEFERTCEPAESSGSHNSTAGGRKKGRRRQASKVDPSLVLGFTSSSSRIMQGTIETPELK